MGKLEDNIMKSLKRGTVGKKIQMPSASGQAKLNKQLEAGIKKIMSDFMSAEKKQTGGKIMTGAKTKYMAKGGAMKTKYMAKGGAMSTKYASKGSGKVTLSGMTARRNAMRGK